MVSSISPVHINELNSFPSQGEAATAMNEKVAGTMFKKNRLSQDMSSSENFDRFKVVEGRCLNG